MRQPTQKQLLDIAHTYINGNIPTLQSRNSDALDFYEVSVWNLEAALTAAFVIGWQARDGKEEV